MEMSLSAPISGNFKGGKHRIYCNGKSAIEHLHFYKGAVEPESYSLNEILFLSIASYMSTA